MLALTLPNFIAENIAWWIGGAIVVFGLLIYGFRDLLRFSVRRAWAISSVSFAESIRRRILWITPLAIIGVIIVSQLQRPLDEQDAIRQTIKFALFATGLVVTVSAIILACTNLPKEIESRVIYTVVTKPTTRLEIVVGKVLGFARVSAAILLIMGVFTFAYLHLRAWNLRRDIDERLRAGGMDSTSRATLEYWRDTGLLRSRSLLLPLDLNFYSRVPPPGDSRRWMFASEDESFVVPFMVNPEDLIPAGAPPEAPPAAGGVYLRLNVGFAEGAFGAPPEERMGLPEYIAATKPATASSTNSSGTSASRAPSLARVMVQILDSDMSPLLTAEQINEGVPIELKDPTGKTPVGVYLTPEQAANLLRAPRFFVEVAGATPAVEYFVDTSNAQDPIRQPVTVVIPSWDDLTKPQGGSLSDRKVIAPPIDPQMPYRRFAPNFRGRLGTFGQQLRGGAPDQAPVAVMSFGYGAVGPTDIVPVDGRVPFELRVGVERSGDDELAESATKLELVIDNQLTSKKSAPIYIFPESNRTVYFTVPADAVEGGQFDVLLRNLTPGNYIGMTRASLAMVASEQSFNTNLLKSLLILWLLAILVVVISIFASTFLSWPIATVLTLVILLGNWAVLQLGPETAPGIGNAIAQDLGFRDPSSAKTVSSSVEALARFLNAVAKVLPDISQFSAVEDIERGITITASRITAPLLVLAAFALPLLVVSYVILRNKEVAP